MEVSLKTQPQKILTLKCTGMCTLLLVFAVSGAPAFFGCMHEAARQAELNQETGGEDALATDFGQSAELAGYGGSDSWIGNLGASLDGEGDLGPDPAAANAGPTAETGDYDEPVSETVHGDYADEEAGAEPTSPIAVPAEDELDIESPEPALACVATSTTWRNFPFSAQTGVFSDIQRRTEHGINGRRDRRPDAPLADMATPPYRFGSGRTDESLPQRGCHVGNSVPYASTSSLFRLEVDAAATLRVPMSRRRVGPRPSGTGYAYRTEQAVAACWTTGPAFRPSVA